MRYRGLWIAALAALLIPVRPASAWKPRTHVYLAEQALSDALDDGKVTLYRIDPATNRIQLQRNGKPVKLGDFRVRPEALEALRRFPAQFRAGVLGPDAFPDLVTGQTIIHPAGKVTPGETDVDLNLGGVGTDPWLRHLWERSFGKDDRSEDIQAKRAFTLGFFAHAAGDMYGHTLVNHYTGGAFHFAPEPGNAIRHIVLEGYVDRHVPDPTFRTSLDSGVDGFIYRQMVYAEKGSQLEKLQDGANSKLSLAAYFSQLRARLEASLPGSSLPAAAYKRAWIKDIDAGLKALPAFSHQLGIDLFFNPRGKADLIRARARVDDYVKRHLLSMCGMPDAVGLSVRVFEGILSALGLQALQDMIREFKKDAFHQIVTRATGLNPEELRGYLDDPALHFDQVMNRNPLPGGARISRAEFDSAELGLAPGEKYLDYQRVPAAYNTVALCKLSLLAPDEVNRLMELLGSRERLIDDNIMLGYIETLDGSRQWLANGSTRGRMVLARDQNAYRSVFMRQSGEEAISKAP